MLESTAQVEYANLNRKLLDRFPESYLHYRHNTASQFYGLFTLLNLIHIYEFKPRVTLGGILSEQNLELLMGQL